jgi:NAD(P) transhydrogenase subunit alpha
MSPVLLSQLTIFVLAVFVGFEVISKVPVVLHTPLMSATNAIHGIVVIGGILVLGYARNPLEGVLGTAAVLFGAMNFAGGFVVTDRMLEMFKKKPQEKR